MEEQGQQAPGRRRGTHQLSLAAQPSGATLLPNLAGAHSEPNLCCWWNHSYWGPLRTSRLSSLPLTLWAEKSEGC